jgi:hypothetical protein
MALQDKMHFDREQNKWVWNSPQQQATAAPSPSQVEQQASTPAAAAPQVDPAAAAATPGLALPAEANMPVIDPNALDRFITPENTLTRQRIGFDVRETDPTKIDTAFQQALETAQRGGTGVGGSANLAMLFKALRGDVEGGLNREEIVRRQFESQLPFLDEQFAEQGRQLAQRTAAMGRTGSGMVDRSFADLNLRGQRGREGLLGSLTSQAAQQEIADRLGLYQAGSSLAGVEAQRDIANAQAKNSMRGVGLNSLLGAAGLDLQRQGLGIETDLNRRGALVGERNFERQLGRDAQEDAYRQAVLQQQGYASNPAGALQQGAGTDIAVGSQYGANAASIGDAAAGAAQAQAANVPPVPQAGQAQVYGTPTGRPRLTRPGSTINTTPIPTTPTDFGAVQRGI